MKITILSVVKIPQHDSTVNKLCRCRVVYNNAGELTEELRDVLLTAADLVNGSSKKAAIRAQLVDVAIKEGLETAPTPDNMVGNEYTIDA